MLERLPNRWRTIRWRLTLWYVALLALALAAFAGVFYFGLRYLLYDALDDSLRARAELVEGGISYAGGELSVSTIGPEDSDDQFLRVTASGGRVILDTSGEFDEPVINRDGVAAAFDGEENLRWTHPDDDPVRILSVPLERDGEVVGVLEVGAETEIDETLATVARLLAISIPAILLVAAGGGFWLARRALLPIDRITRTAAGIGERDLAQRIDDAPLPDDELGRLARTFNAMLERIERAFERQRRFTADAAHELRTPLALMRSQIDLALADRRTAEEQRAALAELGADVDRLTRLTGALLTLARGDAGGLTVAPEPLDLAELLDLIAEQYAPLAEERDVRVDLDVEPVEIQADGDLLIQVLANLMDNALRHAPEGSAIQLGCRAEGARARVWVSDQGPGIPAEHLPQIFERFYRADAGRDRARGGAGLGLAISRMIVEAHGGTLAFESAEPGATRIVCLLPRA